MAKRGRPKSINYPQLTHVYLSIDQRLELKDLAAELDRSMSYMIRQAIDELLERYRDGDGS